MTKKPYPKFDNDDDEQEFLDSANLEEYHLTAGGAPMRKWLADYEDMYKDARVNLRLPKALVLEFKRKAAARPMPYQRLKRAVLQEAAKTLGPRARSSQKNGRATILRLRATARMAGVS